MNDNNFSKWIMTVSASIMVLGIGALIGLIIGLKSDVAVMQSQINELSHVNKRIEVMQTQIISLQSDFMMLKYEIQHNDKR